MPGTVLVDIETVTHFKTILRGKKYYKNFYRWGTPDSEKLNTLP